MTSPHLWQLRHALIGPTGRAEVACNSRSYKFVHSAKGTERKETIDVLAWSDTGLCVHNGTPVHCRGHGVPIGILDVLNYSVIRHTMFIIIIIIINIIIIIVIIIILMCGESPYVAPCMKCVNQRIQVRDPIIRNPDD